MRLREYLDELERRAIKENNLTKEFSTWLSRPREKADWYDPLIEKEDKWLDGFDRDSLENSKSSNNQWR